MPLYNHDIQLKNGLRLGLWHITESVDSLLELCANQQALSDAQRTEAISFASARRQREYLATRLLCRHMLGRAVSIGHSPAGRPYIASDTGPDIPVSISHTDSMAAVLLYGPGCASAVDVERITPRIERISGKFLTPGELSRIPAVSWLEHLYIHWCAKEAMYKAYNISGYDYQNSYALYGISADGIHKGRVAANGNIIREFDVMSFRIMDYVLCVATVL